MTEIINKHSKLVLDKTIPYYKKIRLSGKNHKQAQEEIIKELNSLKSVVGVEESVWAIITGMVLSACEKCGVEYE